MTKEPTERDYQRYVGDSFKAFNDRIMKLENQIQENYKIFEKATIALNNLIKELESNMSNYADAIKSFSTSIKDLDSRLVYLEEENLRRERAEVVAEAVAIEKELQSIENGTYDYEG